MRRDTQFPWLVTALVLVLASAVGCTRSLRPEDAATGPGAEEPPTSVPVGATAPFPVPAGPDVEIIDSGVITIDSPASDSSVGSPVTISGQIDLEAGRLPAAQVLSRGPDGDLTRRGNGPIPVDDDGSFEVAIDYNLDVAGPGAIEVVIVNPVTGAVTERERIIVELEAAP